MSTIYQLSDPEKQAKVDEALHRVSGVMGLSEYDRECLKYLFGMRNDLPPKSSPQKGVDDANS
jgi:hypothetical protein